MMSRRPRATGGRHLPSLAPTYSVFKPRSEWNRTGASVFLYVNLPGFYRDQIKIESDGQTRTLQIKGERPLSTQTKARFNETYHVPEQCDMSQERMKISFSRGLLTIEMPIVVEAIKPEKRIPDQWTEAIAQTDQTRLGQKPEEDERRKAAAVAGSPADGSLERKKLRKDEKLADEKEVIGQKVAGGGDRNSVGSDGLRRKQSRKDEEESRQSKVDDSLRHKQSEEDENLVGEMGGKRKIRERVKPVEASLGRGAETRTGDKIEDVRLKPRTRQKVLTKREDEERETGLRFNKGPQEELRRTTSSDSEREEVNVGENIKKKVENLSVETELSRGVVRVDIKDRKKINQDGKSSETDGTKKNLTPWDEYSVIGEEEMMRRGELTEGIVAMGDEKQRIERESLVNVGVAALVIMGFGAYLFVPLLKLFD